MYQKFHSVTKALYRVFFPDAHWPNFTPQVLHEAQLWYSDRRLDYSSHIGYQLNGQAVILPLIGLTHANLFKFYSAASLGGW